MCESVHRLLVCLSVLICFPCLCISVSDVLSELEGRFSPLISFRPPSFSISSSLSFSLHSSSPSPSFPSSSVFCLALQSQLDGGFSSFTSFRPANLPPKTNAEAKKHRNEVLAMNQKLFEKLKKEAEKKASEEQKIVEMKAKEEEATRVQQKKVRSYIMIILTHHHPFLSPFPHPSIHSTALWVFCVVGPVWISFRYEMPLSFSLLFCSCDDCCALFLRSFRFFGLRGYLGLPLVRSEFFLFLLYFLSIYRGLCFVTVCVSMMTCLCFCLISSVLFHYQSCPIISPFSFPAVPVCAGFLFVCL